MHYARDAFEGLKLMDTIMSAKRGETPDTDSPEAIAAREKEAERKARHERSKRIAAQRKANETPVEVPERSDVAADVEVPVPPFWGTRVVKGVAVADYAGLLDERALFLGQWGLRGVRGGEGPSYEDLVEIGGTPAVALLAGPAVHRRHPRPCGGGVRVLPGGVGGRRRDRARRTETRCGRTVPVHLPAPAAKPVPVHRRLHPVTGRGGQDRSG